MSDLNHVSIIAGGAPLQWRVMSGREARGPEEHDRATGVARAQQRQS